MYRDPKLIKKHIVKVRLDDESNQKLEALADLTGEQKAALTRELITMGIDMFHATHLTNSNQGLEGLVKSLTEAA